MTRLGRPTRILAGRRVMTGFLLAYSIGATLLAIGWANACREAIGDAQGVARIAEAERKVIEGCLPDSSSDACHTAVDGFDVVASDKEQ